MANHIVGAGVGKLSYQAAWGQHTSKTPTNHPSKHAVFPWQISWQDWLGGCLCK